MLDTLSCMHAILTAWAWKDPPPTCMHTCLTAVSGSTHVEWSQICGASQPDQCNVIGVWQLQEAPRDAAGIDSLDLSASPEVRWWRNVRIAHTDSGSTLGGSLCPDLSSLMRRTGPSTGLYSAQKGPAPSCMGNRKLTESWDRFHTPHDSRSSAQRGQRKGCTLSWHPGGQLSWHPNNRAHVYRSRTHGASGSGRSGGITNGHSNIGCQRPVCLHVCPQRPRSNAAAGAPVRPSFMFGPTTAQLGC